MRILIVSHNSFSKVDNNGKTLESIFRSFSKENLAQVFFTENKNPDFDFCNNYFRIADIEVLKSLLKGFSDCGIVLAEEQKNLNKNVNNIEKGSKLFRYAKSKVDHMVLFRDLLWSFNSWKSKPFLDWSSGFKPDVIFYVGGNFGFSHNIARFLFKHLEVPLVTYFTDDYLIYPKNKNLLDSIQRIRMKKFYAKTVQQSSLCFAIGDLMAEEYSSHFCKEFLPIMNSIEKQEYYPYLEKQGVVFSYFGGLHLNRWKMLIRLANSLSIGSLNVYSIEKPSEEILIEFAKANIKYIGAVEGTDLKNAILGSDVLLHVESDDLYNRTLTKLSVSTKIPEYLMSGRLVLGFGPEEVASMKILSDNKIGVVIASSISDDCLKSELIKIVLDFELRKRIGLQGYDYACENFDNKMIANRFKERVENLIISK
jgi:glycosyltransferase involved in cell wall biosynthesis